MTAPETYSLDYNAGGPVDPRVLERFVEVEREVPGNPGSLHSEGRRARGVLEEARREVAGALGGLPVDSIVFTSGGTEADNLAVHGLGDPARPVLCGELEHAAVLEPAQRRGRIDLPVDARGFAVFDGLEADERVRGIGLVALVHAQNETGCVQPVERAAAFAASLGVPLHVDAAQTLGRVALDDVLARADSVALSMHKAGGIKGVGLLVVRRPETLQALTVGGGQEQGLRPGTVPVGLAAAAARTVALAVAERARRAESMRAAREAFLDALSSTLPDAVGMRCVTPRDPAEGLPNTATCVFAGVRDGRTLLPALDMAGVHASQGSACSSGSSRPPRVLLAMGFDEELARRAVRFAFGPCIPPDAAARAAQTCARVLSRMAAR